MIWKAQAMSYIVNSWYHASVWRAWYEGGMQTDRMFELIGVLK